MAKSTFLLIASLLAACSGEAGGPASPDRSDAPPPPAASPGPPAPAGASAGRAAVVLPRLPASEEGDSAALQGRLAADGPCLYVETGSGRYLIAALSPSLTWDKDARRLTSREGSFAVGDDVMLGGSESSRGTDLPWTTAPDRQCDARRIWIATGASARRA